MGLFQRIIGTRTADQFVFYYSKSLLEEEVEQTITDEFMDASTRPRPGDPADVNDILTPEYRRIVEDKVNRKILDRTKRVNADIAAARLHKSKNVGFFNKEGVQIGERVRGRDVARRTSMFALPDTVLSQYGLPEVGIASGHHVTFEPGGRKHTRSYKNVK